MANAVSPSIYEILTIGKNGSHTSFRAIPKIDIKWSFPFINYESKKITIIEPIIQTIIS